MKKLRYLYVLILMLLCATSIAAQDIVDGSAFYIYRNDGDFDGFFYDQVEEMRFSKIDLDGVEHDEYVIQEVVTADSTYRIPLAAIDSVGFVQPELKFASKVRHMDMLGMSDYLVSIDDMTLTFKSSMPQSLRPKRDDVLIGFTGLLAENGFAGRVIHAYPSGENTIIVPCERLEQLSDVFEQFVTVEQVGTIEDGGQEVRRMAGYNQLQQAARTSSGGSVTLVDLNLNAHIPIIPDLSSSGGAHFNVDFGGSFKARLCTVLQVSSKSYFFKAMLTEDYSLQIGASMGIHGSGSKDIGDLLPSPLDAIKFPATCPIFEVRPFPQLAVRYGGSFSANVTFPVKSGHLHQTFTMDSDNPGITYKGNEYEQQGDNAPSQSIFDKLDVGFTLSGTVQAGIKQQVGLFTNGWFDFIFSAGMTMDMYLGPKLEGTVSVSASDLLHGDGPYSLRNSNLSFTPLSLDYEAYGEYTDAIMAPNKLKWTFADGNFSIVPKLEMYMFPELSNMTATVNKDAQDIDASYTTNQRMVFWPAQLGVGLMDSGMENMIEDDYPASLGFATYAPYDVQKRFSTKSLKAGSYNVMPMLKAFGGDYPVKSMAKTVIVPPYLKISQTELNVGVGKTSLVVPYESNADVSCRTNYSARDWIECQKNESESGKSITINVEENERFRSRKDSVEVIASGYNNSEKQWIHINQPGTGKLYKAYVMMTPLFKDGEDHLGSDAMFAVNMYGTPSPDYPNRVIFTMSSSDENVSVHGVWDNKEIWERNSVSGNWGDVYLPHGDVGRSNSTKINNKNCEIKTHWEATIIVDLTPEKPILTECKVQFRKDYDYSTTYYSENSWVGGQYTWQGTYTDSYHMTYDATIVNVPEDFYENFVFRIYARDDFNQYVSNFKINESHHITNSITYADAPSQTLHDNKDISVDGTSTFEGFQFTVSLEDYQE